MTTMIAKPTRGATRNQTSRDLERLITWLDTMPDGLGIVVGDFTPIASKMLNRPIDPADFVAVFGAVTCRDIYPQGTVERAHMDGRVQQSIDQLLERMLAVQS